MTPHQLSFVLLAPRFTKKEICVSPCLAGRRELMKNTRPVPSSVCVKAEVLGLVPLRIHLATHPLLMGTGRCSVRDDLCFRAVWWQRWSGRAVTRTWESGLNSRHSLLWSLVPSGLHLLQLISHLACVVRALCQTHRLWKNNLTGFNLPPPHATPLSLLPLALFFRSFCVALRRREPILFGSSRLLLRVKKGRFEASDL